VNGTWRMPETYNPHRCIDGTITFTRHQIAAWSPELELTVELDAASTALRSDFAADERKLVHLENPNTGATKNVEIDGAYNITDWGAVGGSDQDGVQTLRLMFSGEYDPDWAKLFEIIVTNGLAQTIY
jgi:hypothetical protein